ncbi:MAG: formate--tetrahydrofolate ligase [Bacilli bacterium]|jgi:formate--tetrahydrofolate ligase|nr:formate--tetrahydrofolate ligase [Bacilli bacterium]
MLKDYEIAHQTKMKDILQVADKLHLKEDDLFLYGKYKAKVFPIQKEQTGNVILVTAINPTPYGEGKTTVAIGLYDALCQLHVSSCLTLREPSLGPVFGVKGGATGGGYAQVLPMEDINLHFNGDFHAITSANNLISAMIDNHIMQGNDLEIDLNKISFLRTIDMNDRALRHVEVALGGKMNGIPRRDHFTITAASEIMAVFCVSKDLDDLRRRIDQIIVAQNVHGNFVTVKDLGITGSVVALLKDAMNPNLVQTLEGNPVLVHGGPFANIAPGVNSVSALSLGRKLASYVITEAGFGSDLGGFKFCDIICRENQIKPLAVVLVVTIKALKYHGTKLGLLDEWKMLERGLSNLEAHMDNLDCLNLNYVVTLNKYASDLDSEIQMVQNFVVKRGKPFAVNQVHAEGGKGALLLAKEILKFKTPSLKLLYQIDDLLEDKIYKVCTNLFHAKEVIYLEEAKEKLALYQTHFPNFSICVAKTQYSISDQKELLGYPKDFTVTVRDLHVSAGAQFIVVYLGNIMTMPGLSKNPAALDIDVTPNGEIRNIF